MGSVGLDVLLFYFLFSPLLGCHTVILFCEQNEIYILHIIRRHLTMEAIISESGCSAIFPARSFLQLNFHKKCDMFVGPTSPFSGAFED